MKAALVMALGTGLVAALAVSGCGSATVSPSPEGSEASATGMSDPPAAIKPPAGAPSFEFTPPSESEASSEPTVVAMSPEQAGEYYLNWICWSNSARDQWSDLMNETPESQYVSKEVRKQAEKEAAIHRAVADALENPPAPWPVEVQKDILKVAGGELNDVSAYGYWSKADSRVEVAKAIRDLQNAGGVQAAQRVRLRLGLPVAGGKKDGCWIRRNADGVVPPPAGAPSGL